MAKNPADRFQTAEELAEALRDALASLSRQTDVVAAPAAPTPPIPSVPTPALAAPSAGRRWPRSWLVAGALAVAAVILALFFRLGLPPNPPITIVPTPTLGPNGDIQPIPKGVVYLGDLETLALGFNMDSGGSIINLRYNGRDLGTDILPALYDGNNGQWHAKPWDMKVQEYRTSDKSVYIKASGKGSGETELAPDVIFETWAWQRDGYFQVHFRTTHAGTDYHTSTGQEFPAAYFAPSLTREFGYFGAAPFTGARIEELNRVEGQSGCPDVVPTENWAAFGTPDGLGLILAVPPQPYVASAAWALCLVHNDAKGAGYISPRAIFDIPPGAIREETIYLIPGPIDQGRAIVYNLIPHTTWTFDLNSLEGWHNSSAADTVENGILAAHLSPDGFLMSRADLRIPGAIAPTVTLRARAKDSESNICLQFLTANDPNWDKNKSACLTVAPGEFQTYTLDFKANPAWNASVITQLGLTTTSKPTTIDIDALILEIHGQAWEFEVDGDAEGWDAQNQLASLQVSSGHLTAQSTGNDPSMVSPRFAIDAKVFPIIEMSMKVSSGNTAELFFVTNADDNYDGTKSSTFAVIGDGQFHRYTLDMSAVKGWNGTITQIRLDPTDTQASVEVDNIRMIAR
jgi:hypothetical protein